MTKRHEVSIEEGLQRLADLAVRIATNVQPGQELILTAPLEAHAFVHLITECAYKNKARLVTCLYDDPVSLKCRLESASDETLDSASAWLSAGIAAALGDGAARLFVVAPYPDLLTGVPPERILRMHNAMSLASKEEFRFTSESKINWSVLPFVTESWARTVFPEVSLRDAKELLWRHVFRACRIDNDDLDETWRAHSLALKSRREWLQEKNFSSLRFFDGFTDLQVGLIEGHRWVGGSIVAANGVEGLCNIPHEEVFTCPHRERVDGTVLLSKPIAIGGTVVDSVRIEFRNGIAECIDAGKGDALLKQLLSSDDASRRLGEVALVPANTPLAASEVTFYNALFDENTASHFAFGNAFAATYPAYNESIEQNGVNQCLIHIDCVFGNDKMNVDGWTAQGTKEAIMRDGHFVI